MSKNINDLVALCKRRGFIYQSCDIYGGLQGLYDLGPLGVELKQNLKNSWWQHNVYLTENVFGLDSSILTNKHVLASSGHVDTFTDPMVDCKDCKARMRADHLVDGKCDNCGSTNLTEERPFNLMFKTNFGPTALEDEYVYLRPETAQGIFVNFKNICDSMSPKIPFGIAQIGKAFRNEVSPRNFIFRVREFEQMELEFFVEPGTDHDWHKHFVEDRVSWWQKIGLSKENIQLFEQPKAELAHYAKATTDILYEFPHGLEELEGIANRADFDLGSHSKNNSELGLDASVKPNEFSTTKLQYRDQVNNKSYVPYVIEPSAGVERGVFALLCEAYTKEKLADGSERVYLNFTNEMAPIKASVIPLAKNNAELVKIAKDVHSTLTKLKLGPISFESTGNIGKSYRKNDEIGTPYCITVDFESLEKGTLTVRERNTMQQTSVKISNIKQYLLDRF
jgi:glycyl-tRNA synthetase